MGDVKNITPVKFFSGIIAVNAESVAVAVSELTKLYGAIDDESEIIPFTFTDYYTPEMGDGLLRKFVCFAKMIDPGDIVDIKLKTNDIEAKYAISRNGQTVRTINLDPGYLCASRLVLATTKDFSHRIYIGKGIYGEVTLNFCKDGFRTHPWTYPDFKSEAYQNFFLKVRGKYLQAIAGLKQSSGK